MAFPTGTMTSTTLAEIIPDVWGERLNDILRAKLVLGNFFTDRSSELAGGGDHLFTPSVTEMTAASKTVATAVTLNQPTEVKIDLAVDQWYEVSFMIEDKQAAQVKQSYYIQEKYASNAAYTIATKLEVALAALFIGFANTVGGSVTAIQDSDIRKAIGLYEGANNDPSDGAFFFDTKVFWNQLQNIDKFSLAINSPVQDPVAKRPQATLYGYPVWLSNNIQIISGASASAGTGRANALASKDALHWARSPLPTDTQSSNQMTGSMGVRVQTHYIPEYLGFLTTADLVYGTIENRDTAGVYIKSLLS
jgi:hypothetical protein